MKKQFNDYISILLYEKKKVIIPKLGCIISKTVNSSIYISNVIPPYKELFFNPSIKEDKEDVLINYIHFNEKIPKKIIRQKLDEFVEKINMDLKKNKEATIDRVGKLYIHQNKLYFLSQLGINYLKGSFGLPLLINKKIDRNKRTIIISFAAAGTFMTLVLFIIFWRYYYSTKPLPILEEKKTKLEYKNISNDNHDLDKNNLKEQGEVKENYFIIIGAFKSNINTNLEIKKILKKEKELYCIKYNNFTRISIAKLETREQAEKELKEIVRIYKKAWILKTMDSDFKKIKHLE